jgi:choline kinase
MQMNNSGMKANPCLILAAGKGTRLRKASNGLPKPLVDFRGKPILEHIILGAQEAGINRFVIVVGYGSELIRLWFNQRFRGRVSVTWVENPEYEKQNGISALKARDVLQQNFLLLMADHVFEPQTARVLIKQPLAPGEVILAFGERGIGNKRICEQQNAPSGRTLRNTISPATQ